MSLIRKQTIEGLTPGITFTVTRSFSRQQVEQFADMTRDYNPIHFDERFVATKGFRSKICHGLLVGSMVTEVGGQIGWLASGIDFRFKKPVFIDDVITCTVTIEDIEENGRAIAEALIVNQDGDTVMTAKLKGIIPGKPEIEVLKKMICEDDPTNKLNDRNGI